MASVEQRKADCAILRLVEKHKREKEEVKKRILELERNLAVMQKLELKIAVVKGELVKHIGRNDDAAVQNEIEEMSKQIGEMTMVMDDIEPVCRDAHTKILKLERDLDVNQKLELLMVEAVGKLEVIKHLGSNDDAVVKKKIKEMKKEVKKELVEELKKLGVELKLNRARL